MKNNLHSIAAHLPFADTLAGWMLKRWGGDPITLSRAWVLLPTRRAAAGMREAFLRASGGKPLLLPRMLAMGDADGEAFAPLPVGDPQLPTEAFETQRLFALARLVQGYREKVTGRRERMDHAVTLAQGLADLMDGLTREECSLDNVTNIVPDAFSTHWQETVEFLNILSQHWPVIAEEEGWVSPLKLRGEALMRLARHWNEAPPDFPVVAAGSTGSIPSTRALIAAVAKMPQGAVVLPGFDLNADEEYFAHLEESHPQWGMTQLVTALDATRADVQPIGETANARVWLLSEALRPAEVSHEWRGLSIDKTALAGLHYIACGSLQEEATVIALMLRETLQTPGKTAALVTHHRGLAQRVAANMRRFGVVVDDSAGLPLTQTPLATFLRLCADAAAEKLAPLPLLMLLKHPLAHAGMERIACLEAARALEKLALRGLRAEDGVEGIRRTLRRKRDVPPEVMTLLQKLELAFAPMLALMSRENAPLIEWVEAHIVCAELLGGGNLWDGPEAEAVTQLLWEIRTASAKQELAVEGDGYGTLFESMLAGKVLRPQYGMHPRLKILSPMEARMLAFDRVILGGLNEGSWPPSVQSDPWFSRPMRAALGLPSPERETGLAAHDFFMQACGAEVMLTRAGKEDGVPTQESRWLVRLSMLTGGLPEAGEQWRAWAKALDAPEIVKPASPPEPRPPLAARPRELAVTQVETLMRDPYALYASLVLKLRALEPLGREPGGADFGNAVHDALERFVIAYPKELPQNALPELLRCGREAFSDLFAATGMEVVWWPRFMRIAQWMIEQEETRRGILFEVKSEVETTCRIGGLLLKGRVDRLELGRDGSMNIVDYKTGGLPPQRDIEDGLSSQLVLLALIARVQKNDVKLLLEYWQLQGNAEAGNIRAIAPDKIERLIDEARDGLTALIERYNDPDFPYRSTPIAARASRYSDYEHLARTKEWH